MTNTEKNRMAYLRRRLKFRTQEYVNHVQAQVFTEEYRELEWSMIIDFCGTLEIPLGEFSPRVAAWIHNHDTHVVEQEIEEYFGREGKEEGNPVVDCGRRTEEME